MNRRVQKNKKRKFPFLTAGIIFILAFSFVFIWIGNKNSSQANAPTAAKVSFQGEYKIGDGEWHPIVKGEHISSTCGDVTLRGFFQMHDPTTNDPVRPLPSGVSVNLYFNHIGGTIYLPSGHSLRFDAENESLGEDACATMSTGFVMENDESSENPNQVTIVLHNPHKFGNENAIDDFLENISIAPLFFQENNMLAMGATERNIGMTILITALIILGIAAFSSIIHIRYSKEMWLIGFMSMFAGGYFLFDSFAFFLWNESNIINTRGLGLCAMLYMLFCSSLIVIILKDKFKKLPLFVTSVSAVTIIACITLSFTEKVHFYDTWLYWASIETVIALVLIICLAYSLKKSTLVEKLLYSVGILTLTAFCVDIFATHIGWWEGGLISKHVFLAIFLMALVVVLRVIPSHINAAIKARELEAEQQALKLELQESRISIMLSQMQPHFIFNTLNTIYHLCEIDPHAARSTISSFSEYLRNNIDNLGQSDMILFEKELSFIKTYLDIEKVRFDDELEIAYDIEATSFKLPVLTVQPIVENAVKHGTSKKDGVARLTISTRETDTCYEIKICDTGVGFDTETPRNDGHKHVGISNVRQRLENLCGGTLAIESTVGEGTTATITIPKKEAKQ